MRKVSDNVYEVEFNLIGYLKIFLGTLRAAEFEHLMERFWYALTETCLVMMMLLSMDRSRDNNLHFRLSPCSGMISIQSSLHSSQYCCF